MRPTRAIHEATAPATNATRATSWPIRYRTGASCRFLTRTWPTETPRLHMTAPNLTWFANYFWAIPDHMQCHVSVRSQDRDGIFPQALASGAQKGAGAHQAACPPHADHSGRRRGLEPDRRDGTVRHHTLNNHGMGTVFAKLVRRSNEENKEKSGEHFTPRDAATLMATLVFLASAREIDAESASPMTAPMRKPPSSRSPRPRCTGSRKRGAGNHPRVRRSRPATDARGAPSVFAWTTESICDTHPLTCARCVL